MIDTEHTTEYILSLANRAASLETAGGKGASLARLAASGLPVPDGFHVTTAAYRRFVADNAIEPGIAAALEVVDPSQPGTLEAASQAIRELFEAGQTPPDVASAIALAYASLAGRNPVVAVRSSATAEDLPDASFAGQQETFLNVEGYGDVLQAVKRCWSSLWTSRAIGYRAQKGITANGLSLAVVVQLLVPAEAAGILFTANPLNGRRDQAVISASWGLGEAVVGGLVTPDHLTMDTRTGNVIDHTVSDKEIMTIRVNGGTREEPVPPELRRAPALDHETAAELVRIGGQIQQLYGMPMDIEWALADGALSIVQARPITALPEVEPSPLAEWPMPDPKGPYMRGSIADFMPAPLTPLFATMGLPAINQGMGRTLDALIGGNPSLLADYVTTINDYAYLHVKLGCSDWLWVLFRMGPALPRLLRSGESHWREVARPRYRQVVDRWHAQSPGNLTALELLDSARQLTDAMADYLTSLQVDAIGTAAGTEGLFTAAYDKLVKREGDPPAATLLLGADSTPIQAEKALWDLAQWSLQHEALTVYLLETPTEQLAGQIQNAEMAPELDTWNEWRRQFRSHLDQFGHTIYDLDFAQPLPAEDPQPLLAALKLFLGGQGTDPHQRQADSLERRQLAVQTALDRLGGLKRRFFRWTLRWAQTFALVREDSIFDIGLGYPVIRRHLHELGSRLVEAGTISQPADVYWLQFDELERAARSLERNRPLEEMRRLVEERQARWRTLHRLTPPQQLPPKARVMGIRADAFMPVSAVEQTSEVLKGVPASGGKVTATARVLHGPEDFSLMQPGDILVAEITTPAWTPLFAMAAGVVTDIGGPLSHGSIVAREYGIPAVLGTGVATQRIRSGQTITVDGSAGTIVLA